MDVQTAAKKDDNGYYGWVFGTAERELVKGRGIAHGLPTSSYRSEAVGGLSMLVSLEAYLSYCNRNVQGEITTFCDNEERGRSEQLPTTQPIQCNSEPMHH